MANAKPRWWCGNSLIDKIFAKHYRERKDIDEEVMKVVSLLDWQYKTMGSCSERVFVAWFVCALRTLEDVFIFGPWYLRHTVAISWDTMPKRDVWVYDLGGHKWIWPGDSLIPVGWLEGDARLWCLDQSRRIWFWDDQPPEDDIQEIH